MVATTLFLHGRAESNCFGPMGVIMQDEVPSVDVVEEIIECSLYLLPQPHLWFQQQHHYDWNFFIEAIHQKGKSHHRRCFNWDVAGESDQGSNTKHKALQVEKIFRHPDLVWGKASGGVKSVIQINSPASDSNYTSRVFTSSMFINNSSNSTIYTIIPNFTRIFNI